MQDPNRLVGLLVCVLLAAGCAAPAMEEEEIASVQEPLAPTLSVIPNGFGPAGNTPAVVRNSCGLHVFVRGTDNALWRNTHNGSQWGGWVSMGGILKGAPGAGAVFTDTDQCAILVAVRNLDNGLSYRLQTLGNWGQWKTIPGATFPSFDDVRHPAVVFGKSSAASPAIHVLFWQDNNVLRWVYLSDPSTGTWSNWQTLPNGANVNIQSSPAATSTAVGNGGYPIKVLARGGNGKLWWTSLGTGGVQNWSQVNNESSFLGGGIASRLCGNIATYYVSTVTGEDFVTYRRQSADWQNILQVDPEPFDFLTEPSVAVNGCDKYDAVFQSDQLNFVWVQHQH